MRFFSRQTIQDIIVGFQAGLRNYPLTLLISFLCATLTYREITVAHLGPSMDLKSVLVFLFLSIPLSFTAHVWQRKKDRSPWMLGALALALVLIGYATWIRGRVTPHAETYLLALCMFHLHLLVACVFFTRGSNSPFHFWRANIQLFHRFLFALVVSGIVGLGFVGLAHLFSFLIFDLGLRERFHVFVFCATGIFLHTWVFVAGLNFEEREVSDEEEFQAFNYLKHLLQYVSIPLLGLYIAVLWLYLAKIGFTWNLPKGQVSYFVVSVAIAGLLTFLLGRRFAVPAGSPIFLIYRKYFFFALFPLLILLWIAVVRRISDYGITPDRYVLLITAAWLSVIVLAFILKPERALVIIPSSLFIITWVLVLTPLSIDRLPVAFMMRDARARLVLAQTDPQSPAARDVASIVTALLQMKGADWVTEKFGLPRAEAATARTTILTQLKLPLVSQFPSDRRYLSCDETAQLREIATDGVAHVIAEVKIDDMSPTRRNGGGKILKSANLNQDSILFQFHDGTGIPQATVKLSDVRLLLEKCPGAEREHTYFDFVAGKRRMRFYESHARGSIEPDGTLKVFSIGGTLVIYK